MVQNYEIDFYLILKILEKSRLVKVIRIPFDYITVSKWCKEWLKDEFNKEAGKWICNGIDIKLSTNHIKEYFKNKVRILIGR
ncbi:MAG: hypothetical protein ACLTTH_16340 [Holdemanella porci]